MMRKKFLKRYSDAIYMAGCLVMVAALFMRVLDVVERFAVPAFLVGACAYTVSWLFVDASAFTLREKRLMGMAFFSGVLFILCGVASIMHQAWWSILLVFGTVLFIYSNISINRICSKKTS
ncbi:MAG: hypothetical protein SPI35_04215 [Porphyromonas sp.]|nr:hypothetical protein [Porphyromonas sp.]